MILTALGILSKRVNNQLSGLEGLYTHLKSGRRSLFNVYFLAERAAKLFNVKMSKE